MLRFRGSIGQRNGYLLDVGKHGAALLNGREPFWIDAMVAGKHLDLPQLRYYFLWHVSFGSHFDPPFSQT